MIASEVEPFAKVGGLGDVLGSLPNALCAKGLDVRVVMPKFSRIPDKYKQVMKYKFNINVNLGWRSQYCGVFEYVKNGVTYYFLDNEYYFGSEQIYGASNDIERFCFFSRSSLDILPHLDFQPEVIHCHDWESAAVPILFDAFYKNNDFYRNIKMVFTIHNLKYQGVFDKETINDFLTLPSRYYTEGCLEHYGDANLLKGAVAIANFVTTVSPTYSYEIREKIAGEGIDGLLRTRSESLGGIINGINYDIYSPQKDEHIAKKYTLRNYLTGKRENKLSLQKQLGLNIDKDIPLISIISRLTDQKGLDLIMAEIHALMNRNCQIVVLGTGERRYEDMFRKYAWDYSGRISANIMFDEILAHQIYAGSDIFLMPSLYEPCGLGQIISMAYGTIPVVRQTGGLKDTIIPYNQYTGEGNGFGFREYDALDMLGAIDKALEAFAQPKAWAQLVKNAMRCKYDWSKPAEDYLNIYSYLTK